MAQRELRDARPACHVVCFLAQQCAEKYLKGFLEEQNVAFQKQHDLVKLLDLAAGCLPELDPLRPQLLHLGAFGIAVRYPGPTAGRQEAEDAVAVAGIVRSVIRARLGLEQENHT